MARSKVTAAKSAVPNASAPGVERHFGLLAAALSVVFFVHALIESHIKSPTSDEPPHLASGLSYVSTGILRANPEHPPLLKELSGLSLLLGGVRWPRNQETEFLLHGERPKEGLPPEWEIGNKIIASNGPDMVMFWARLPFLLIASLLAFLIYWWGRRLLGGLAALCATLLYIADPTMLGHSYLVATDVGVTAFTVLLLFAVWSYLESPSTRRLVLCGLALGAVLCAKFSGVFLLPVIAIMLIAAPSVRPWTRCATVLIAMCAVAVVFVGVIYLSPKGPALYAYGMSQINANHVPGYQTYLAGELRTKFIGYFGVAYLLKEPVASIVLAVTGLAILLRSTSITRLRKAFLLVPAAVLFAAPTLLADQIGVRYIMPVLPFAHLLGGLGLARLLTGAAKWSRWAAAALCLWLVVAAAGVFPDHLSYFNESACLLAQPGLIGFDGGSKCGIYWLDDSNVDWGGGLKQLKTWLDVHARGRRIRYSSIFGFPPEAYGIPNDRAPDVELVNEPSTNLYVVSATLVARISALPGAHIWMRRIAPVAVVGHSLYIYDVP